MTEPITPETTYPRSLKVSEAEQSRNSKQNINHDQLVQEFQEKSSKRQSKVIHSEKSEGKKVDKEKGESGKRGQSESREAKDDRDEEDLELDGKGIYIDIKV